MNRTIPIVVAAVIAGGLAGAVVGLTLDGHDLRQSTGQLTRTNAAQLTSSSSPSRAILAPAQIYKRDAPAVVVITATQTQAVPSTLFSPAAKQKVVALGSGFVIDERGDIVTNDHVVQGGTGIRVGFSSGSSYPATIIGTDQSTDVAVVRVKAPASALHPLRFDGSGIEVGDPVYAIGNPFGLDRTMTAGIVSALGRDITAPNGLSIPNAIQTDAPINHGNSGGPLLDRFGHVVGITSQIEGGTVNANVGVGFAVPADTARAVADQLLAHGRAEHAFLGVAVETIDPAVARAVRGQPSHGVAVARVVKNGPAARAGIEPATGQRIVNGVGVLVGGDTIVSVDGKPVATAAQLAAAVALHQPGDSVTLEVTRGGASRTVEVTLGNAPEQG